MTLELLLFKDSNAFERLYSEQAARNIRTTADDKDKLRGSGERFSKEELARLYNFEPANIQRQRELELLEDFKVALPGNASSISSYNPSLIDIDGTVFINSDFTTGIIQLNRTIFNKNMSMEDRRKVLFGSDQIIP